MIEVTNVILLLWVHWIADFIFQTDTMALNKSKSNKWLAIHILVYTAIMCVFGFGFAVVNGALHLVIDWCTSRVNAWLWQKNDRYNFFVMVGFDQFLHIALLMITWEYLK